LKIVTVPGGYQRISSFHRIQAKLPLLQLEDPSLKYRFADVAFAQMLAEPFRPPTIAIESLVGKFWFTNDSLWWTSARVVLPKSRIAGRGWYDINTNNLRLRVRGDPVASNDLKWISPNLPAEGSGRLGFGMNWVADTTVYVAKQMDVTLERSRIRGDLELTMNDTFALHKTNLQVANLDTRLVQRIFPTVKPPRHGLISGRAQLEGGQHALDVNGDVTFDERRSGRSRVVAVGRMGFGVGSFEARNLRLTLRPLQMDLAKAFAPSIPLGGTLTGTATLNGTTTSRMVARGDITHVERGALSRVTGSASFRTAPGATMANSWFDVDARLHPLSLVTVGRFFPKAGLRGTATGTDQTDGNNTQSGGPHGPVFPRRRNCVADREARCREQTNGLRRFDEHGAVQRERNQQQRRRAHHLPRRHRLSGAGRIPQR
jgi:hypothetical protein